MKINTKNSLLYIAVCLFIIWASACNFAPKKDVNFYVGVVTSNCAYNSSMYDTAYIDTIKVMTLKNDSIIFFYKISNCELSSFSDTREAFPLNNDNYYSDELGNNDFIFKIAFKFHSADSLTFTTDYYAYEKTGKKEDKFKSKLVFSGKKAFTSADLR
jgi:hypothetical protein